MNTKTNSESAHALTAAKWIGRGAYAIAATGTVASYGTQVGLLLAHEVGGFSYAIPATVDVLAICAAMALQLPDLDKVSRRIAAAILLTAVAVSVAANLTGGHNTVARIAHAWPVIAYLLGELLANRVRAYAHRVAAKAATTATVAAPIAQPAPAAIVTAAITPPAILRRPPVAVPAMAKLLPLVPRVAVAAARSPRPRTITATVPPAAATEINPRTGEPFSIRHARRLRTGR